MHKKRVVGLDIFRGWAIFLMLIFHFSYDLSYYKVVHIDFLHDPFWECFRYIIVSIFLLSVGMSLVLVHTPHIRWNSVYKRVLILGAASIAVSLATYYEFPRAWVYFGILHLIFVSSLLALPFLRFPYFSLFTAITVFVISYYNIIDQHYLFMALRAPLHLPRYTVDLARFLPWFGAVLLGIFIASKPIFNKIFHTVIFDQKYPINKAFAFAGRHALVIYLLHLPILFWLVGLFVR